MSKENKGWISVKEQMPKEFKTVLVSNGNIFIAELNGNHFVTDYGCITYRKIWGVTHWQPLPEPPKE